METAGSRVLAFSAPGRARCRHGHGRVSYRRAVAWRTRIGPGRRRGSGRFCVERRVSANNGRGRAPTHHRARRRRGGRPGADDGLAGRSLRARGRPRVTRVQVQAELLPSQVSRSAGDSGAEPVRRPPPGRCLGPRRPRVTAVRGPFPAPELP